MLDTTLYSSNAIPTTRQTLLRVRCWSVALVDAIVWIRYRQLTPDNQIIESVERLSVLTTDFPKSISVHLTDDRLISVSVWTSTTSIVKGQIYSIVEIQNGDNASDDQLSPLLSGYVSYGGVLNFPQSIPEAALGILTPSYEVTVPDPAAGAPLSFQCPTDANTRINAGYFTVSTGVAVPNRTVTMSILSNGNLITRVSDRTVVGPGASIDYLLWPGSNLPTDTATTHYLPIADLPYADNLQFTVQATNFDAADQFSGTVLQISTQIQPA